MSESLHRELMTYMVHIEPVLQLEKLLKGRVENEFLEFLKEWVKYALEKTFINKKTELGFLLVYLFIIEWVIKLILNKKYFIPNSISKRFPRGIKRLLRAETRYIAEIWVSLWHALSQLYSLRVVNQHPANLLFFLLLESGSNLFITPGFYTTTTKTEIVAVNQRINSFLENLDATDSPFPENLVATNLVVSALRNHACQCDRFRSKFYRPFITARVQAVDYWKKNKMILVQLDKEKAICRVKKEFDK